MNVKNDIQFYPEKTFSQIRNGQCFLYSKEKEYSKNDILYYKTGDCTTIQGFTEKYFNAINLQDNSLMFFESDKPVVLVKTTVSFTL